MKPISLFFIIFETPSTLEYNVFVNYYADNNILSVFYKSYMLRIVDLKIS